MIKSLIKTMFFRTMSEPKRVLVAKILAALDNCESATLTYGPTTTIEIVQGTAK